MKSVVGKNKKSMRIIITLMLIIALTLQVGIVFADDDTTEDPPVAETNDGETEGEDTGGDGTDSGDHSEDDDTSGDEPNGEDQSEDENTSDNETEGEDSDDGEKKEEDSNAPLAEIKCQEDSPNCEVLPEQEDEPVDGIVKVSAPIPGTDNGGMILDLTLDGQLFKDLPAYCGNEEDKIWIGQNTPMKIGLATNLEILNAIAAEYGFPGYTEKEAYLRGTQLDDALGAAVLSGDYTEFERLLRDATQNIPDETIIWVGGDDEISSYWGLPNNSEALQSILVWIEECIKEGKDPRKETPPAHIIHIDTGGSFF